MRLVHREEDEEFGGEIDLAAAGEEAELARRQHGVAAVDGAATSAGGSGRRPRQECNRVCRNVADRGRRAAELYQRPDASRESRALGTAIHALFEKAAKMLERMPAEELRASLGPLAAAGPLHPAPPGVP